MQFLPPHIIRLNVGCTRGFAVLFEGDLIPHFGMAVTSESLGAVFGRHTLLSMQQTHQ